MKTFHLIICLLTVFCVRCFEVQASNRVKVATISASGYGVVKINSDNDDNYQRSVNRVKSYWKREIDKVLKYKPDLILLTEICDYPGGISSQEKFDYLKARKNQVHDYFASIAKENRCYIAFGTYREEKGIWYNSCVVLDREGKEAGVYHKNYPSINDMASQTKPGTEISIIQCDFGALACVICFDLNYNELRDRCAALKPDIVLFPTHYHGGLVQAQWAYDCRSFFVSSFGQLTGVPSEILNPQGNIVATSTNYTNYAVATINLDRKMAHLDENRGKFTALQQKYGDKVIITEPGRLGSVMITSEHDRISATDMVKEFNIELLDDYLDRAAQVRLQKLNIN